MNRSSLLGLLCVLAFSVSIAAQPNDAGKPASKIANNSKPAKDPEAERLLKERRDNAQNLLINLASDAGRFNDQTLRARTQARIADVLWSADRDRARALFRKAWESAEMVDQESKVTLQELMKQQREKRGGVAVSGPANIRGEVLRLAARHDRKLGEEFLAKLKTEKQQETTEASDKSKANPLDTPEAISQRLNLARQLLDTDVARALQFADPALSSITSQGLDFLSDLRAKDAAAADGRYSVMLAMAANNLSSDANTVSLLSSYLFTPHIFVTFGGGGTSIYQMSRGSVAPQVAPELRAAFFRAAAEILLRPLAAPGQDQTSAGIQGKYLTLKRLLPLFEQFAPKEMAETLRGQMEALANAVPEDARQRDDNTLREGIRPEQSKEDREKALLDQVDHAKTSDERDALYVQLAGLFSENADLRARDYVDKIEDSELRQTARAYIDATMLMRAVEKKDASKVLELLRRGELTHLLKAWALSETAKGLVKSDRDKAMALLDDATTEALRIENSDADRPRAFMAVANAWFVTDRGKTWDAVYEAARAANSAEGFTGEDGMLRVSLFTKSGGSVRSSTAQDFNVAGIFTELAKEDYNRAIELARGFQREAPRASATIAIARSVLEEKKK